MSKPLSPVPPPSASLSFLSVQQWTALELEWPTQERQLPQRSRTCVCVGWRWGGMAPQILMRCTVSMATFSEEAEKKGALSVSLRSPLLCAPFRPAPSLHSSCPPPQLVRGFVRRQMIPQMPRPSRPFQLHSPGSPQVRGHHRASEWVSVATVAMVVESGKGFVFTTGCHGQCFINLDQFHTET